MNCLTQCPIALIARAQKRIFNTGNITALSKFSSIDKYICKTKDESDEQSAGRDAWMSTRKYLITHILLNGFMKEEVISRTHTNDLMCLVEFFYRIGKSKSHMALVRHAALRGDLFDFIRMLRIWINTTDVIWQANDFVGSVWCQLMSYLLSVKAFKNIMPWDKVLSDASQVMGFGSEWEDIMFKMMLSWPGFLLGFVNRQCNCDGKFRFREVR